ncbi:MAG: tryptophan synthase subunit alpha [Spirochaetaceae bacterium]|jgi:tryptophan synthase alpha chain|nr:tryptophan synthase subunit alpha [Spirochaetaceae bacterium]
MSNIEKAFSGAKAFIGFVTGGDPDIDSSAGFALDMADGGADLVEIGIPFSDPIAEGPVIQEANIRALSAGTTTEKIFTLASKIRKKSAVPLVFLTYLNPVFRYGYERFFSRSAEVGVDGIIVPDLPFEEQAEVRDTARSRGIDLISLIAPTSKERISAIARNASGFLYLVSSMGVTGVRGDLGGGLRETIAQVRAATKLPAAVGFGIHTPAQAAEVASLADGVIVGSAIVKLVAEHGREAGPHIRRYVREMKAAMNLPATKQRQAVLPDVLPPS